MPRAWLITLLVSARLLPLAFLLPTAFPIGRPWRWSLRLWVLMAAVVVPMQLDMQANWMAVTSPDLVVTRSELLLRLLHELVVGLSLGFGFTLFLCVLQIVAAGLGQMTGLSWIAAPPSSLGGGGLQRYFGLLAGAVFFASDGHLQLIEALLDSFQHLPPGHEVAVRDPIALLSGLLDQTLRIGIRIASPIALCLLIASLSVALIGRNGSMLGGFSTGVALNLLVLFVVSWATMPSTVGVFRQSWSHGIRQLLQAIGQFG